MEVLLRDRSEVVAIEDWLSGQQPIGDRAEGVDIGIRVDLSARQLLWGKRFEAAGEEADLAAGRQQFVETPHAEVADGNLPIHLQIDAIDGEIAVVGRILVGIFEGGGDLVEIAPHRHHIQYAALREPLAAKAHAVLLIGAAAAKIAGQLEGAAPLVDTCTLQSAIAYAVEHGKPGDTVLLAPACASFDQFRSYEHRGEVFKEIVNQLQVRE